MRKVYIPVCLCSMLIMVLSVVVDAQITNQNNSADASCEGLIYKASEPEKRAVIVMRPKAELTDEARTHKVSGRVKLKAVLCKTGKVTDVQIIEGLPFGMTDKTVEAVRQIKFTPAQMGGQAVSQELVIDFSFSYIGKPRPPATGNLEGRMIESITTEGYSQSAKNEVQKCLSLLEGQAYNKALIEQVWWKLLKLEDFDPQASTMRIEESERGGIGIVYLLEKRPKN